MFKKEIKPLSEGFADAISKSINRLEHIEEKATRPADSAVGDTKPQDISGEEEVKTDGSAKKAPARKGDQAQADSMEKVKEEVEAVEESMDPVDKKALKGKHSDRKDKDIDNDGDVDSSDEYLHKRRKAISKALKKESVAESKRWTLEPGEYATKNRGYGGEYYKLSAKDANTLNKYFAKASDKDKSNVWQMFWNTDQKKAIEIARKGIKEEALDEKMTDAQKKTAKSLMRLGDKPRQAVKTAKGQKEKDKEFYRNAYEEVEQVEEAYKTPEEASAFEAGKKAARSGKKYSENPHNDSRLKLAWSKGHNKARAAKMGMKEEVDSVEENWATKAMMGKSPLKKKYQAPKDGEPDRAKRMQKKMYGNMMGGLKKEEAELDEARKNQADELYFDTYSAAVQYAKAKAEKMGYAIDEDDWHNKITTGPGKPGRGKTVRHNIALTKGGKPTKKGLAIQVYNRETDKKTYELNAYVS